MKRLKPKNNSIALFSALFSALFFVLLSALTLMPGSVLADELPSCSDLPGHAQLKATLETVVHGGGNGGLETEMWATIVNRDGVVCAVAFSGENRGDQWPGSRVISAQKANTANAFSLPKLALSTANLFFPVQPGESLFGLQFSNPVVPELAYRGDAKNFGQPNDPIANEKIGGIIVFGGGLALYNKEGTLLGGLGLSGDTSCSDHIKAWKVRHALNLDNVPAGVSPTGDDNIIYDLSTTTHGYSSESGFGHPTCDATATEVGKKLPKTHPTGPEA